jgi:homoserine kinase type II
MKKEVLSNDDSSAVERLVRFDARIRTATHIVNGNGSDNFSVVTDKGKFVVKVLLPGYDAADRRAEAAFAARAAAYGIPTPSYLRSAQGDTVHVNDDGAVMILPFLKMGAAPVLTEKNLFEIGRTLACLHEVSTDGLPDKQGWMGEAPQKERMRKISGYRIHPLVRALERLDLDLARFRDSTLPSLPIGLIHGDAHPGNMLFTVHGMTALLDWEDAMIGPRLVDFCVSAASCCFDDITFLPHRYRALRAGYESVRGFTPVENAALPECMRYVGVAQASWRFLTHFVKASNQWQETDFLLLWARGMDRWTQPE